MDLKKTGDYIAQRRKGLDMTQKQLADRLGVTDKAVSRWETGKGFPDAAFWEPLAQALEITVTELVNGEDTQPQTAARQADDAVLSAMRYTKRMGAAVSATLMAAGGVFFTLAPLVASGVPTAALWAVAACLFYGAVLQFWGAWPSRRVSQAIAAGALLGALVLECLPGSAVLVFAGPEGSTLEYCACFDFILLWGNAHFAPFLAAALTAVTAVLMAVLLIGKKEKLRNPIFVCTVVAAALMVLPLLLGAKWLTVTGFLTAVLLGLSAMLQARANDI